MSDKQGPGNIVWTDLTVPDAESVRDFYQEVVGWSAEAVPMGDYSDFTMKAGDGTAVAGVCHTRGVNEGLPAQWLMYLTVEDLEASMAACRRRGGEVTTGPKSMGAYGEYCVIRDPAGAVMALIQPPDPK